MTQAEIISHKFYTSFQQSDSHQISLILSHFCDEISSLLGGSISLQEKLHNRCMNERWRWQGIISHGNLDYCRYDYQPTDVSLICDDDRL